MPMLRTMERPMSTTLRRLATAASSTCCTRWTWLEKLATITRRGALPITWSRTGPMDRSSGVKPGTSAFAESRERAQIGQPAVEGKLVHLEVARDQNGAGGRADGDSQRIRDGVVDGD